MWYAWKFLIFDRFLRSPWFILPSLSLRLPQTLSNSGIVAKVDRHLLWKLASQYWILLTIQSCLGLLVMEIYSSLVIFRNLTFWVLRFPATLPQFIIERITADGSIRVSWMNLNGLFSCPKFILRLRLSILPFSVRHLKMLSFSLMLSCPS